LRLREHRLSERWLIKTTVLGQGGKADILCHEDTRPRSIENTHPERISLM
jgi:hypothetical protein